LFKENLRKPAKAMVSTAAHGGAASFLVAKADKMFLAVKARWRESILN
jgi:hypothetical protein